MAASARRRRLGKLPISSIACVLHVVLTLFVSSRYCTAQMMAAEGDGTPIPGMGGMGMGGDELEASYVEELDEETIDDRVEEAELILVHFVGGASYQAESEFKKASVEVCNQHVLIVLHAHTELPFPCYAQLQYVEPPIPIARIETRQAPNAANTRR